MANCNCTGACRNGKGCGDNTESYKVNNMSNEIDISKLNKAAVLAALYNNSKPQGMGFVHYTPMEMNLEEAQQILNTSRSQYFDYLKGRVMKVDLSTSVLDPYLYNRDNGQGAAEFVISKLV